jgi:ribonuclease-3
MYESNLRQNISSLKEMLGFAWNNEKLLQTALTHGSHAYENKTQNLEDNQRLEFLGDAVLELSISNYLYKTYPDSAEGELTKIRSTLVCEPSLARAARKLNLGACLLIGRGEEHSGGRNRPSILADAFEALLGAIFLDQGLDCAAQAAINSLQAVISDLMEGRAGKDYKTELQELIQQKGSDPANYAIISEEGPDHNKLFTSGVYSHGQEIGRGTGRSKKEAEQHAARQALNKLKGETS